MHMQTLKILVASSLVLAGLSCEARLPPDQDLSCHILASQMMFVPNQYSSPVARQIFAGMPRKYIQIPDQKKNFSWEAPFLIGRQICTQEATKISVSSAFKNAPISRYSFDTTVMGFEVLLEYAFAHDNDAEAKRLLHELRAISPAPDTASPAENRRELKSPEDIIKFLTWSNYHYYKGHLAVKNEDMDAAIYALIDLLELDANTYILPTPSDIQRSHDITKLKQAAIVGNAAKIMDLSQQIFNTNDIAVLTPEHHIRLFKIGVRQLNQTSQGQKNNHVWLNPQFLKNLQSEYENGTKTPDKISTFARNAFDVGYAKFRASWPYDRGPYLWKTALKNRRKIMCQNRQSDELCLSNLVLKSIKP